jgi:hypothetical protein
MLNKWMSFLFRNDDFTRYTPKPWHLVYALLLLAVGTVTFGYEWYFFGFMSSFFGIILGLTILLGMNWDKVIEYWKQIEYVLEAAAKIKDAATRLELLKSMGYNVPASEITVTERREDEHGVFSGMSIRKLPVSSSIMQVIADKILMTGRMEFPAETSELGKVIPNYRKVKQYLIKNNYIVPTNPKNVRLGYSFNRKGTDVLYEYASESIKMELRKKG